MNSIELTDLIRQPEGTNLEFKSRMHEIYHMDGKAKGFQKDEFIRDIISLANNNSATAGEPAYLIFGIEESLVPEAPHKVVGVEGRLPTRSEILDMVNPACDPPIGDILCDELNYDGARVYVVTIPPDPYLHETRRKLQTGEKTYYSEHLVFIRHNQSIQIASAKERAALAEIRKIRSNERRSVPPELLGVFLGATVGGPLSMRLIGEKQPDNQLARPIGGVMGMIVFGMFGGSIGRFSKEFMEIKGNWHRYSLKTKFIYASLLLLVQLSILLMFTEQKKDKQPGKGASST